MKNKPAKYDKKTEVELLREFIVSENEKLLIGDEKDMAHIRCMILAANTRLEILEKSPSWFVG